MSFTAVERSVGIETAQPLFSHRNTTGSLRTAQKFMLSWKVPRLEVPSPKKQSTAWSPPLTLIERPAPLAMGKHPPRVPLSPSTPSSG
jgi:hypothetical protein